MEIDSQFDYTIIMAFENTYKYENKRSISLNKLKEFRKVLLEEILDIYENNKFRYFQEIDLWEGKILFKKIDENVALAKFLEKYNNYFYSKDNEIYLKKNINYDDIFKLLNETRVKNNVPHRFNIVHDSEKLKDILEISSVYNVLKDYYKIEEQLENLYYKLYTKEDNENLRKKIKKLLFTRYTFYSHIGALPDYSVDAFRIESLKWYQKVDDKEISYDIYPIDLELYNEQENIDPDNFWDDMDDRVYDITQYAIFGKINNVLYKKKVSEDIDNFDDSLLETETEEFDPNKDYSDDAETKMLDFEQFENINDIDSKEIVVFHDPTEEFWVLYINYLNNLNKYMDNYGESEELMLAKKRLLYALDKPELMIFDEDNFEKELEKTKEIELEENPFDFFIDEVYFIASEVFKVPSNKYTIRKLILVGTYYNLTQDEEILDIINNFKNHLNYDFFYDVMVNNCSNKNINHDNLPDGVKKLILKPNNKND